MDGQQVRDWESHCIEESPPACNAACPVHVDVRAMMELLRQGDFKLAQALYSRIIPFPAIIAELCDHPCEAACKRGEAGDPIRIHELERACVDAANGFVAAPFRTNKQLAKKRIAVIGAGISGLCVAAELSIKGHRVVVFEARQQAFARLRDDPRLPAGAIDADLARFAATSVELRLGEAIALATLTTLTDEFDAVYLGLGPAAQPALDGVLALIADARIAIDPLTFATSHPKIFAGGSQRQGTRYSPIGSLHDGRYAALSIDRLLQGASLSASRDNQGPQPTRLYVNTARFAPLPAVQPADVQRGFCRTEAIAEAARCFPCHCLECVRACPFLEHFGAYPKRYVREIYNNETIIMGPRKTNRLIDSCTLCGLCAEVCPEHLAMGEVCLSARQGMTAKGKMPPSHHDFALRDLAYSRSDAFALARHQPGFSRSAVLFYPGCQLAASSPEQVEQTYAHLCATIDGGVGLLLGCCGAPAQWAGRQELFAEVRADFDRQWQELGRPLVLTACSSCYRMIADHHPTVAQESLWSVLARSELPAGAAQRSAALAIHDPCTTRHETAIHDGVRQLADRCAISTAELDGPQRSSCCGFGGLASFVSPAITDQIVDRCIVQNDADYLTYCAMCRDNFARRGKRALHVLDLLFPVAGDAAARPDPGFSQRQENRGRLKRHLLRELWSETVNEPVNAIELAISEEVHADLERKLILEDDLRQTIAHAEDSGAKLIDRQSGHFIASHRLVSMTYWVEYSLADGRYVVHRAYSHRMQLESRP
ncbi:MAG: amine oxidase [Proteobacteria bacterium]|nr:amine oxidase [Pseudomonadota bacterium]